jgi:hypothetical protein
MRRLRQGALRLIAALWLCLGCVAALAYLGLHLGLLEKIALDALILPPFVLHLPDRSLVTESVHITFLNLPGLCLVYFIPGAMALLGPRLLRRLLARRRRPEIRP